MEIPTRIESLVTMLAAAILYGAYEHLTLKGDYQTLEGDAARLGQQYANAARAGQVLVKEIIQTPPHVEIAVDGTTGDVIARVNGQHLYGFPGACNQGQFF